MNSLFSIQSANGGFATNNQFLSTHKSSFRSDFQIDNKATFFKGKKAVLFISVGQAYHEGGKFLSTIQLINKYGFKSVDIMMADTLQKYNFIGVMGGGAYDYTKTQGDLWLKRNNHSLNQLIIDHKITRWDELLTHKDYAHYRAIIDKFYQNNADYREALASNASLYLDRLKNINPNLDEQSLVNNGLEYLIEEMPIVMPMWANMGYDVIIYPKPLTLGMRKTYEAFVKEVFPDKCQWIYLRFKKEKPSIAPRRLDSFSSNEIRIASNAI